MNFRRTTPAMLIAIFALLALLLLYLAINTAYWRMDIQCGSMCGIHILKGVVMP